MSAVCGVHSLHNCALLVPTELPALVVGVGKVAVTTVLDTESSLVKLLGHPALWIHFPSGLKD